MLSQPHHTHNHHHSAAPELLVIDAHHHHKHHGDSLNLQNLNSKPKEMSYFVGNDYQAQTATKKHDDIMAEVIRDKGTTGSWFSKFKTAYTIFLTQSQKPSVTHQGDTMPSGKLWGHRERVIHSMGTVGSVSLKPQSTSNHPFTGIFEGASHGIIRLSVAGQPSDVGHFTPGLALKFLRDGSPSVNLVAMPSVDGQGPDFNFFSHEFCNNIPPATKLDTKALTATGHQVSDWITTVGLGEWGEKDQHGKDEADKKYPFKVCFKPTDEVKNLFPGKLPDDVDKNYYFQDQLASIKQGHLFTMYGWDKPEELGGKSYEIGDLVMKSPQYKSKWGDQKIFFRHQIMDDDIKEHPEWADYVVQKTDSKLMNLNSKSSGCPFLN